ncbi:hypothetical protein ACIQOW_09955 [Kitasatospora sp. NPDC091335]
MRAVDEGMDPRVRTRAPVGPPHDPDTDRIGALDAALASAVPRELTPPAR